MKVIQFPAGETRRAKGVLSYEATGAAPAHAPKRGTFSTGRIRFEGDV